MDFDSQSNNIRNEWYIDDQRDSSFESQMRIDVDIFYQDRPARLADPSLLISNDVQDLEIRSAVLDNPSLSTDLKRAPNRILVCRRWYWPQARALDSGP